MRRKARIPYESKIAAVEAYERHEGSMQTIAERFGISSRHVLRDWIHIYRSQGMEGLLPSKTNKRWTENIKQLAVQEYLSGKYSLWDISEKYKISSNSILKSWIMVYNDSHKELKSFFQRTKSEYTSVTVCAVIYVY